MTTDEPAEYLGPTPPPRAHNCDDDCAPFIGEDDGIHTRECSVCGVSHGDPCMECGGRGYHDPDCSEVMDPRDLEDERARAADAEYDRRRDDALTDPEPPYRPGPNDHEE